MSDKPIGLLWDSVSNNTGDKAIGLVLQAFSQQKKYYYQVLDPFSYDPAKYSTIIVGGGELIRELGDPFYDCFRVRGNHILNSTGVYKPDNFEYLNDYAIVTVRTIAERDEISPVVPQVKARPCISLLMADYFPRRRTLVTGGSHKEAIGVHLHFGVIESIPDILLALKEINQKYHIRFIPFTFYNNDIDLMREMASKLSDVSISSSTDPVDIFYEFSSLKGTLSSSLHASIFSYVQSVPILAFPYLPKVEGFFKDRGLGDSCFYNANELIAKFEKVVEKPTDYSLSIQKDRQSLREHLSEIETVLQTKENGFQLFTPQAPWKEKPDGAEKYHELLMHWLHSMGQLKAELQGFKYTIEELRSNIEDLKHTIDRDTRKLATTEALLTERESELVEIRNTRTWKAALLLQRIRLFVAPPNSFRTRVLSKLYKLFFHPNRESEESQTLRRDTELIIASGLFDAEWYLKKNPDVARARTDPLLHYLNNGGFENRDPGPRFSSQDYFEANKEAKIAGINPLLHYLKYGKNQGYMIQPDLPRQPETSIEGKQPNTGDESRQVSSSLNQRRPSVKEFTRKILVSTQVWVANRPILRSLLRPFVPSWVRVNLNRAIQVSEAANNRRANSNPSASLSDWENYLNLQERASTANQVALHSFVPQKPLMLSVDEQNLMAAAKSLEINADVKPEVSIVIPVHNNARLTLECLTSIANYTSGINYEIIIVDDSSDFETLEVLKAVANVSLIRNDERLGFTRTCNRGADAAQGKYVLFLNNDTQVTEGWLQQLISVFAENDRVGAAGAKIIYPDGHLQEAGGLINSDGTATLIGLTDNPALPRYNFVREVDYCSGVCLMVEADVFHSLGGFDELYSPAYYEDVDLCLKIRARALKILYCPGAIVIHHLSATANQIDSSFKLQLVAANRQRFVERWQKTLDELNHVKLIAFYLPQYHPIPENDRWWGKGFTEWTNVTRARPNYETHYQPHLPADLGFYDLRVPEVMEQQAELAKRYNIDGFCYYYYWFHGRRLLELPLEQMLETGKPDFPFCLCWANENWSRRWDGSEDSILIAQDHSDDDDRAVIQDIARYMQHPRYIRVNDKPIILIYRASLFPDIKHTIDIWRESCRANGIGEIYLVMVKSFELAQKLVDPLSNGFDATIEFPPHNFMKSVSAPTKVLNKEFTGTIGDYSENILQYLAGKGFEPSRSNYLTVFPRWDNTPRQQKSPFIFEKESPGAYQFWLETSIDMTRRFKFGDERIVFINAWNEWAEGNHLEPDQMFGHRYLEATRNATEKWQLK